MWGYKKQFEYWMERIIGLLLIVSLSLIEYEILILLRNLDLSESKINFNIQINHKLRGVFRKL